MISCCWPRKLSKPKTARSTPCGGAQAIAFRDRHFPLGKARRPGRPIIGAASPAAMAPPLRRTQGGVAAGELVLLANNLCKTDRLRVACGAAEAARATTPKRGASHRRRTSATYLISEAACPTTPRHCEAPYRRWLAPRLCSRSGVVHGGSRRRRRGDRSCPPPMPHGARRGSGGPGSAAVRRQCRAQGQARCAGPDDDRRRSGARRSAAPVLRRAGLQDGVGRASGNGDGAVEGGVARRPARARPRSLPPSAAERAWRRIVAGGPRPRSVRRLSRLRRRAGPRRDADRAALRRRGSDAGAGRCRRRARRPRSTARTRPRRSRRWPRHRPNTGRCVVPMPRNRAIAEGGARRRPREPADRRPGRRREPRRRREAGAAPAINLERLRWLPRQMPADRIVVNTAIAELRLFRDNRPVFTTRVIVGEIDKQTPELQIDDQHRSVQPALERAALDLREGDPAETRGRPKLPRAPSHAVCAARFGAAGGRAVQRARPAQIRDARPFDVYLHDTPERWRFRAANRLMSHGCVRVREPARLWPRCCSAASPEAIDKAIDVGHTQSAGAAGADAGLHRLSDGLCRIGRLDRLPSRSLSARRRDLAAA